MLNETSRLSQTINTIGFVPAWIIGGISSFCRFFEVLVSAYIIFPEIQKGGKRIWIDCIVLKNRNKFIEFLKKKKIAFREFWLPMNKQKSMMSSQNLKNVNFISQRGLWLTSNFDLTKKDIDETFN